ncbi:MAG: phosphoglucosamine mutase [Epsilonproteobacteria bacterium]|nr:phosphoglucosamine mutase [Campylobacterota bacterium]
MQIAFGTDGIRGNADIFPFTDDALYALGRCIGQWACEKYATQTPKLLIGADTRQSGDRIKTQLVSGLVYEGCVVIDGGILPTPAVASLVHSQDDFHAGIVISASHNPFHDNGIKVLDGTTCKITPEDEQSITAFFSQCYQQGIVGSRVEHGLQQWGQAGQAYACHILSFFDKRQFKGLRVVLDCAHGATYKLAPDIFAQLGAEVVALNVCPDGCNINKGCGALYPDKLAAVVREHNADIGFSFDGDGDRVIAVNKHGEIKNGDDMLALLCLSPRYQNMQAVVGTLMTNQGFEVFLRKHNKQLVRTPVGDKYVAAQLEQDSLLLGGEASGHLILADYLLTGDGIFVALSILRELQRSGNWDFTTFEKYPQVLCSVPVDKKNDLSFAPYAQVIDQYREQLDSGRLVVRYSGTEDLLRVMTEAPTHDLAHTVAYDLARDLKNMLNAS